MARRAAALAGALTATLGLAPLGLAGTERAANAQSNVVAGYNFGFYIGVPGAVSASIVVPKLNCGTTRSSTTPSTGSAIDPGVGVPGIELKRRVEVFHRPD